MNASDTQHQSSQPESTSRIARWIEDPFASVIAGIIAPTFAVVFLLSMMAGIKGVLGA